MAGDAGAPSETHSSGVPGSEAGLGNALDGLFYVIVALFLGIFTKQCLKFTRIPYTVLLLVWGLLLGIGNETYTKHWEYLGPGIGFWENIDPNFLLSLFLPILLFSSAFSLEWHTLRRCVVQVLLLAGAGVAFGTILTALVLKYILPYNWSWTESLLFGAVLSATDPVAVVALLQEMGAPKKLRMVVEGESLVNDGSAFVLFLLFQRFVEGKPESAGDIIKTLCQLSLGGPAVGLAFGIALVVWLRFVYNDDTLEITLTIIAAFGAFIVGNDILGVSGVLAVVTLGIFMSASGSFHISRRVIHPLHIVWEELEFIGNTLIFIIAGTIIAGRIWESHYPNGITTIQGSDYGYAVVLWVSLLIIRALMFLLFYPFLKATGYGITWRQAVVMVWSGLRGAVSLALALFILLDGAIGDTYYRVLVFFLTGAVAGLSILVQGTSMGLLLQVLGLTKRPSVKHSFLKHVMRQVERHGHDHLTLVQDADILGPPDYQRIALLTELQGEAWLRKYASKIGTRSNTFEALDEEAQMKVIAPKLNRGYFLQEARGRLLRAVRATYDDIFERAHISVWHIYHLRRSVDKALDRLGEPLCDWSLLEKRLKIPKWIKAVQRFQAVPSMSTWVRRQLYGQLEECVALAVAFHFAHHDAVSSMQEFDLRLDEWSEDINEAAWQACGTADSVIHSMKLNVIQQAIMESREQCRAAEAYLHAMKLAYPEALSSVRTKQVSQELLLYKERYIASIGRSGLMEERELAEMGGLLERRLKQLHYAPPSTPPESPYQQLRHHMLFRTLPPDVFQNEVMAHVKLRVYEAGEVISQLLASSSQLVLVTAGCVRLETGEAGIQRLAEAGCVLGIMALVTGNSLAAQCKAATVVEAFLIPAPVLRRLMGLFPAEVGEAAWQAVVAQLLLLHPLAAPQLADVAQFRDLQEMLVGSVMSTYAANGAVAVAGPAVLVEGKLWHEDDTEMGGKLFEAPLLMTAPGLYKAITATRMFHLAKPLATPVPSTQATPATSTQATPEKGGDPLGAMKGFGDGAARSSGVASLDGIVRMPQPAVRFDTAGSHLQARSMDGLQRRSLSMPAGSESPQRWQSVGETTSWLTHRLWSQLSRTTPADSRRLVTATNAARAAAELHRASMNARTMTGRTRQQAQALLRRLSAPGTALRSPARQERSVPIMSTYERSEPTTPV